MKQFVTIENSPEYSFCPGEGKGSYITYIETNILKYNWGDFERAVVLEPGIFYKNCKALQHGEIWYTDHIDSYFYNKIRKATIKEILFYLKVVIFDILNSKILDIKFKTVK